MSDLVCVGAIGGAFGVRGEARIKSFCATPEDIETYSPLVTEDGSKSFTIILTASIKNGFAARLSGVETKEQADALRGTRLFAPRDRLPSLPDDEYYHADLIGLTVSDTGGAVLGEVVSVQNHGAGDLLEVRPAGTSETVLLPFTMENVPTVDLAAGKIVADPPEGLFD
ncbi:ribosome maturation factor RimM [Arenibacterium sp. CAU 1754]